MGKVIKVIMVAVGMLGTLFFGYEAVYIGLIASEEQLAQYPWGTELGWTYLSPGHYVLSAFVAIFILWLPSLIWVAISFNKKMHGDKRVI
ncbi:MAG: hypothetical protein ACPH56_13580 [Spongiibacter marinus]|uniref:hypothetical protein n=1 Tax=Spongiibacter marinus TaxID=354246 RepID=UPI003C695DF0